MGIKYNGRQVLDIYVGEEPVQAIFMNGVQVFDTTDRGNIEDWVYNRVGDNIILSEYTGNWNRTVYVPKDYGNSMIGIDGEAPFYNNPNAQYIDLQGVPFVNGNMDSAFYNDQNLVSVKNISKSIVSMNNTFTNCVNFNQKVQIPSSVTSMAGTFAGCTNFNQPVQIPEGVTNVGSLFSRDSSFNQPVQIPNSVTKMFSMFNGCTNFNQPVQIPDDVENMNGVFSGCTNFNQEIQIPSNVTNMISTFNNCWRLKSFVNIHSAQVVNAENCFRNVTNYGHGEPVSLPFRYINNVNTVTFNTFKSADLGTPTYVVYNDPIAWKGYKTWTGNGTHWILQKWEGNMLSGARAVVPHNITSYDTFPTALSYKCFTGNKDIMIVDLGDSITWNEQPGYYKNDKNFYGAFANCSGLRLVNGIAGNDVVDPSCMFYNCFNLTNANVKFTNIKYSTLLFARTNFTSYNYALPSTLTSMWSTFRWCHSLEKAPDIPISVTSMATCFHDCPNLQGDINILSPVVTNIKDTFKSSGTNRKNLYLPYMYDNGTYTPTYNSFYANSTYRNTATFHMYDSSPYNSVANYIVSMKSSNLYLNTYRGESTSAVAVSSSPFAGIGFSSVYLTNTAYTGNKSITSVDGKYVPFTSPVKAFSGCSALSSVSNIYIPDGITSAESMFDGCSSLRTIEITIPNSVTSIKSAFRGCKSATDIVIRDGFGITTITDAWNGCTQEFAVNITLPSPNIPKPKNFKIESFFNKYNKYAHKNFNIYFTYANGVNTVTFNTFRDTLKLTSPGTLGMSDFYFNISTGFYVYNLGRCPI